MRSAENKYVSYVMWYSNKERRH